MQLHEKKSMDMNAEVKNKKLTFLYTENYFKLYSSLCRMIQSYKIVENRVNYLSIKIFQQHKIYNDLNEG